MPFADEIDPLMVYSPEELAQAGIQLEPTDDIQAQQDGESDSDHFRRLGSDLCYIFSFVIPICVSPVVIDVVHNRAASTKDIIAMGGTVVVSAGLVKASRALRS